MIELVLSLIPIAIAAALQPPHVIALVFGLLLLYLGLEHLGFFWEQPPLFEQ